VSVDAILRERIREYYTGYYRDTLGIADWSTLVARREDEESGEAPQFARLRDLLAPAGVSGPLLNVGCGTGGFDVVAASAGVPVVGVDADAGAIGICALKRRKLGAGSGAFVRSLAEALPFRDGAFGVVYCFSAIEHVESVARTVSEMVRVTRPGGVIYLHTPNAWSWYEGHYKLFWAPFLPEPAGRLYLRLRRRPTGYLRTLRRLTPSQLTREFRRHGVTEFRFFDDDKPRESAGRAWSVLKHYYRATGFAPFIELVARKA